MPDRYAHVFRTLAALTAAFAVLSAGAHLARGRAPALLRWRDGLVSSAAMTAAFLALLAGYFYLLR